MITKRNGNGQTECVGCKEKGKFALSWDCFLYNFNNKPYCFECLMEKLENYQQRIDKTIKYIENHSLYEEEYDYGYEENSYLSVINYEVAKNDLLEILKGDNK